MKIKALYWSSGKLFVLDQRLLPHRIKYHCFYTHSSVIQAIKNMTIRGAPAIGLAVAFGLVLSVKERNFYSLDDLKEYFEAVNQKFIQTRPTTVNIRWAVERMKSCLNRCIEAKCSILHVVKQLESEAKKILKEDLQTNLSLSEYGAKLLNKNSIVLTHCNAGALATAGYGTALGIIREAFKQHKIRKVFIDETRPYLQGARLTAFELQQENIPCEVITDNMAGYFMRKEKIDAVIVGADRIATNGDTANKIGTYTLAILSKYHKIPFYVAAPTSSIDTTLFSGKGILIEERSPEEVAMIGNQRIVPKGVTIRHPAFDITPARLITAIITEKGIYKYPYFF